MADFYPAFEAMIQDEGGYKLHTIDGDRGAAVGLFDLCFFPMKRERAETTQDNRRQEAAMRKATRHAGPTPCCR